METREDLIARARELIAELEAAKSVDEMTGDELLRAILQKLDAIEEELKRRPMAIYEPPHIRPWIWGEGNTTAGPLLPPYKIAISTDDVPRPLWTKVLGTQGTAAISSFTLEQ